MPDDSPDVDFFSIFCEIFHTKTGAYPLMRGSVSVEKRASGGLSLSTSQTVY